VEEKINTIKMQIAVRMVENKNFEKDKFETIIDERSSLRNSI